MLLTNITSHAQHHLHTNTASHAIKMKQPWHQLDAQPVAVEWPIDGPTPPLSTRHPTRHSHLPILLSLLPLLLAAIADTNTSVDPTSALQPQPLRHLSYLNQDATGAASIFAVVSPSGPVLCLNQLTVFLRSGAAFCVVITRRHQRASGGVPISPFLGDGTSPNSPHH